MIIKFIYNNTEKIDENVSEKNEIMSSIVNLINNLTFQSLTPFLGVIFHDKYSNQILYA